MTRFDFDGLKGPFDTPLSAAHRIEEQIEAIEKASTMDALKVAANSMLIQHGLKHVVYHAISIPSCDISNNVMIFTYPDEWVEHYVRRNYHRLDTVVRTAASGILPVDWSQLDRSPPSVRALFGEANESGIGRQGLTIPIRGAAGEHAIFTVTSDMSDGDWAGLRLAYARDMQIMAAFIHTRVLGLLGSRQSAEPVSLSNRERESLQWAAAGKTIEETAIILSLSSSTVRVYLDSARHKLGCISKSQAVARAVRSGII